MSICNQVETKYQSIKNLTQEYLIALESRNSQQTKILHAKLEQIEELFEVKNLGRLKI